MNPTAIDLGDFDVERYLKLLVAVAAVDGIHPLEEDFLQQQAHLLGVPPTQIPAPTDVDLAKEAAGASGPTRRILYRDCFIMAHADGHLSDEETEALETIRVALKIPEDRARDIERWTEDYSKLLSEGERLIRED